MQPICECSARAKEMGLSGNGRLVRCSAEQSEVRFLHRNSGSRRIGGSNSSSKRSTRMLIGRGSQPISTACTAPAKGVFVIKAASSRVRQVAGLGGGDRIVVDKALGHRRRRKRKPPPFFIWLMRCLFDSRCSHAALLFIRSPLLHFILFFYVASLLVLFLAARALHQNTSTANKRVCAGYWKCTGRKIGDVRF